MTFIITLFALLIERFFHWHHLRRWNWFIAYQDKVNTLFRNGPARLLLLLELLIPVMIIFLIQHLLRGWLFGILELFFGLLVLLYCLGPENLWVKAYEAIQLQNTDFEKARSFVQKEFGIASTPNTYHPQFVGGLFIAAYQRIFSVIFWFILFGPVGAVLYRLIELFSLRADASIQADAMFGKKLLDWMPVRLFAFIFALAGHFTPAFLCYKEKVQTSNASDEMLLSDCGKAALDIDWQSVEEVSTAAVSALALLDRVFAIVLFLLAVLVLVAHVLFN